MNTTLRNLIGFALLAAIVLAMAGRCLAAAPTVAFNVASVSVARQSPCALHACLDFASCSSGDGSDLSKCLFLWSLECDDAAIDNLPAAYRYITDPRPYMGSMQVDYTGNTTNTYNRPQGWNYSPLVTAGTWRIKCTAINPSGETASATSSDIVVAANTRTSYTVGSGQDYETIASAISTIGATTNNVELVLDDGGGETVTSALEFTGSNWYIHQAGSGARYTISWNGSGSGNCIQLSGESFMVQGVACEDISGGIVASNDNVAAFGVREEGCCYDCMVLGDSGDYRLNTGYNGQASYNGVLIFKCGSQYTRAYTVSFNGGGITPNGTCVVGSDFGLSSNESVMRTTGDPEGTTAMWTQFENNGSKSCFRMTGAYYISAYGCVFTNGDNWTGEVNTAGPGEFIRINACYASGTKSNAALIMGAVEDSSNQIACNCIAAGSDAGGSWGNTNPDSAVAANMSFVHNTIVGLSGGGDFMTYATTNGSVAQSRFTTGNIVAANLFCYDAGKTGFALDIGNDCADIEYNIFPATQTGWTNFARVYDDTTATTYASLAAFETGESTWAANNQEEDVTLDDNGQPSESNIVPTQAGVYADYYGNARGSTSEAGHANGELQYGRKVLILK